MSVCPAQLSHEVLLALKGTEHEWLGTLLEIFNRGDLDAYGQILPRLLQQPDLAARQLFLRQKISMMALVEMLFRRDAGDRRVTFDAISVHIRLPRDEVKCANHKGTPRRAHADPACIGGLGVVRAARWSTCS